MDELDEFFVKVAKVAGISWLLFGCGMMITNRQSRPKPNVAEIEENKKKLEVIFKDDPILMCIARRESGYIQSNDDGSVLRGKVNSHDVGIMQINLDHHGAKALALGFNLYTLEGNTGFALYLYRHDGIRRWNTSPACLEEAPYIASNR